MSAYLFSPLRFQPLDGNGRPYPGALLRFMATGTTTPMDAWTTPAMNVAHEYPIQADSDGKFPAIYLDSLVAYRAILTQAWTDPPTNSIYGSLVDDIDPINVITDVPGGTVVAFMGTAEQRDAAYPSALWTLCDGTNSSYDMRNLALIGAGGDYSAGEEVGSISDQETSSNGAHDHTGNTGATTAPLPAHTHYMAASGGSSNDSTITSSTVTDADTPYGGDSQYRLRQRAGAANVGLTSSAGSGGSHTHSISSSADHTHTVPNPIPPSRAVWLLMRKF